jgi:integrase
VFPHPRDGGPLRSDPLPIFKEVLAAAGLPKSVRLHDCRHTFGFTLRSRGVPLETLMGLMRHANIEETMVYARYSDEEGAKSIEVLNGFGI